MEKVYYSTILFILLFPQNEKKRKKTADMKMKTMKSEVKE